jgi:predicted dehydrogenase
LKDPDVDAVLICTRHYLHASQAILAAKAGKAIFLEKPAALNATELDQLVEVLNATGIPFMLGYNRRFSPAAQKIKNIITGRKNPLMILYRMNAGYLPPDHWTLTKEGGGRIVGEACHIIDLFQFLVDASVAEISSTAIKPHTEHVLAQDNVAITLKYEDGSVATLLYTSLGTPELSKEYMEVYVDGKVLLLDDYRSLKTFGTSVKGWSAPAQDKGHLEELRVFGRFLRDKGDYPISLADIISTSKTSMKSSAGF